MGTEKKRGVKAETRLSKTLHKRFKRKVKKNRTSMAQAIRDAVQAYVK